MLTQSRIHPSALLEEVPGLTSQTLVVRLKGGRYAYRYQRWRVYPWHQGRHLHLGWYRDHERAAAVARAFWRARDVAADLAYLLGRGEGGTAEADALRRALAAVWPLLPGAARRALRLESVPKTLSTC